MGAQTGDECQSALGIMEHFKADMASVAGPCMDKLKTRRDE